MVLSGPILPARSGLTDDQGEEGWRSDSVLICLVSLSICSVSFLTRTIALSVC